MLTALWVVQLALLIGSWRPSLYEWLKARYAVQGGVCGIVKHYMTADAIPLHGTDARVAPTSRLA